MTITNALPQNFEPAARDELAAAGPVEPSASPDLAPGPTLSQPARSRADYFRRRRTPELVNEARSLYRRGEKYTDIARALAVTPDTAKRWLDADYDMRRRHRNMVSALCEPASEGEVPTLAFVPGLIITGRYRMKSPSGSEA